MQNNKTRDVKDFIQEYQGIIDSLNEIKKKFDLKELREDKEKKTEAQIEVLSLWHKFSDIHRKFERNGIRKKDKEIYVEYFENTREEFKYFSEIIPFLQKVQSPKKSRN